MVYVTALLAAVAVQLDGMARFCVLACWLWTRARGCLCQCPEDQWMQGLLLVDVRELAGLGCYICGVWLVCLQSTPGHVITTLINWPPVMCDCIEAE